jgi:hypothetical protein
MPASFGCLEWFLCDCGVISHYLYFCVGLDANDLKGLIPEEIKALSSTLKEVRITNHTLPNNNDLPTLYGGGSNLAALTNLEVLDLSGNKFSSNIPDDFGDLKQLHSLYLNHNQFSGSIPSTLEALTNLKRLYLQNNKLIGNVESGTYTLELLEELVVNENEKLHLGATNNIYQLSNLKILGLGKVDFQHFPDRLARLRKLQELTLVGATIAGRLSDISFAGMTDLKSLSLESTSSWGTVPWSDFSATLTHLSIRDNRLTGALPEDIGRFASLTSLDVSQNKFIGSIPESIGDLTKLEFLSFEENALSGELPPELGLLTSLGTLSGPV